MSMTTGNRKGLQADINVTPMIDVLLVLIIIFMVILPHNSVGLPTEVPQPPDESAAAQPNPRDVVIRVGEDRAIRINSEDVTAERLPDRLREIFAQRALKVAFVSGRRSLEFQDVARIIDLARSAGIFHVGLMTD